MSYPDLPLNRLIVNGVDLTAQYNLILLDGYVLEPPEPKTHMIDIPGGNGNLDLTESLIGDTTYNNRKQEFTFCVVNPASFETVKTNVSNFLHGRAYDYTMTMDPGYTYHGRFTITSYDHTMYSSGKIGIIKISVDVNPFKKKDQQVMVVNAVAGREINLLSGRMRVRPTIVTGGDLKVIYNNKLLTLNQGTWTVNDILLTQGSNNVYLSSYDVHTLRWRELKIRGITWGQFKTNKLYEWYKVNGVGDSVGRTWNEISGQTWGDLSGQLWYDQMYEIIPITADVQDITVRYDWGDL